MTVLLVIAFGILLFLSVRTMVFADVCWPQRKISQHRCGSSGPGGCAWWISPCIGYGDPGEGASMIAAETDCASKCGGDPISIYPGDCGETYCSDYWLLYVCNVEDFFAQCTAPPDCKAVAVIVNCTVAVAGTTCTEGTQTLTYGCWGPGGDTPTPTPMPSCGDIAIAPAAGVPFASTVSGILSSVLGYNLLWDRKCTLATPTLPSACLAWLSMYSLAVIVLFAPIVSAGRFRVIRIIKP
jgi:hypothetical protein